MKLHFTIMLLLLIEKWHINHKVHLNQSILLQILKKCFFFVLKKLIQSHLFLKILRLCMYESGFINLRLQFLKEISCSLIIM